MASRNDVQQRKKNDKITDAQEAILRARLRRRIIQYRRQRFAKKHQCDTTQIIQLKSTKVQMKNEVKFLSRANQVLGVRERDISNNEWRQRDRADLASMFEWASHKQAEMKIVLATIARSGNFSNEDIAHQDDVTEVCVARVKIFYDKVLHRNTRHCLKIDKEYHHHMRSRPIEQIASHLLNTLHRVLAGTVKVCSATFIAVALEDLNILARILRHCDAVHHQTENPLNEPSDEKIRQSLDDIRLVCIEDLVQTLIGSARQDDQADWGSSITDHLLQDLCAISKMTDDQDPLPLRHICSTHRQAADVNCAKLHCYNLISTINSMVVFTVEEREQKHKQSHFEKDVAMPLDQSNLSPIARQFRQTFIIQ